VGIYLVPAFDPDVSAGGPPGFHAGEIHIWTMPTWAAESLVAQLERVLSRDELERASRFRFPHLTSAYVITHGVLRLVLAPYLDQDPAGISFDYGVRGKPAVSKNPQLEFNLTHSDGMAAVAVTTGCPLGIDLEHLRPILDIEEIASRYFCPEEAAEILPLPPRERESAFFRCWTRKEAYIKAIGDGLSCPLDSFQVTVQADTPAGLVHIAHDRGAAAGWTLHDLPLAPDSIAALAYPGRRRAISVFPITDLAAFCHVYAQE
jgi:4'-phosphopantetheinyl transferase